MPSNHRNYPDCPECETDIFVDGYSGLTDYVCRSCGLTFDTPRPHRDGRRPTWVIDR